MSTKQYFFQRKYRRLYRKLKWLLGHKLACYLEAYEYRVSQKLQQKLHEEEFKRFQYIRNYVDEKYAVSKCGKHIDCGIFSTQELLYIDKYINELRLKDPDYKYDYSSVDRSQIAIAACRIANEYEAGNYPMFDVETIGKLL